MTKLFPDVTAKKSDVVYTADWIARDMVEFFRPSGRILEPCKGDGAFLKYLPATTEWCEIEEGRDFFDWHQRVDWIISNPPYSRSTSWFRHSFLLCDELVYLIPLRNYFSSAELIRDTAKWGGIRHIRHYGTGRSVGFSFGVALGALHLSRNYNGAIEVSFAQHMSALESAPPTATHSSAT